MQKVDLHIHTVESDGENTIAEVVQMAKNRGLSAMAITNHDTINGLKIAQNLCKNAGIVFINGVEISIDGFKQMHLLGYGFDENNADLISTLKNIADDRIKRGERILAYLSKKGVVLDYAEVLCSSNGVITRPHIAKAMLNKGYVQNISQAFDKYLATDEFKAQDKRLRPSLKEGISLINNVGGIAVLAHPYSLKLPLGQLDAIVKEAIGYGLKGLECNYARYNKSERDALVRIANKHNLIITTGSDYHGAIIRPDVLLGEI